MNLISVWGIELDLIPVQDEIDLLCRLSKMISFEFDGAASIWFWCSGRKLLVFRVRIETNWIFVSGHRNRLGTRVGIKIDKIEIYLGFWCGKKLKKT